MLIRTGAIASTRSMKIKSYYDILGVSQSASVDEIRRAYRKVIREFHPDLNPDKAKADRRSRELNAALETLTDQAKRERYDKQLERHRRREQQAAARAAQPPPEPAVKPAEQPVPQSTTYRQARPVDARTEVERPRRERSKLAGPEVFYTAPQATQVEAEVFGGATWWQEWIDDAKYWIKNHSLVVGIGASAAVTAFLMTVVFVVVLILSRPIIRKSFSWSSPVVGGVRLSMIQRNRTDWQSRLD